MTGVPPTANSAGMVSPTLVTVRSRAHRPRGGGSKKNKKGGKMNALYSMRFVGMTGSGLGAIYIGKGKLVGIDALNTHYDGTYTQQGTN
ncbi:MAG: hypothetical protein ACREFI_05540, partial [Stellaceae bacterium]